MRVVVRRVVQFGPPFVLLAYHILLFSIHTPQGKSSKKCGDLIFVGSELRMRITYVKYYGGKAWEGWLCDARTRAYIHATRPSHITLPSPIVGIIL